MRSVYIHIPFCNSICSYCDFCKFLYEDEWASNYLDLLEKEIDLHYQHDEVKTIYIGGGTPSSLSMQNLKKLFKIIEKFNLSIGGELTFECNINDINEDFLQILKNNGVNRLSIGVESFNKYNLKFLNRKHDKELIFNNIKLAKKKGFNNINVDLIYAIPIEDMNILKSDVRNLLKLNVEHISTYSLIIEEHTILKYKNVVPIEEELDYKMYKYICKKLFKAGYKHYEVSNFAKEGCQSKHNLTYWDNEEYYGFGLGAHGYINAMRYENTRNFNKYLNGDFRFNEFLVSTQEDMENEMMLGLRKLNGVSVSEFKEKYNRDIFKVFNFDECIEKGYIIYKNDRVFIPEENIYIMNEIINKII